MKPILRLHKSDKFGTPRINFTWNSQQSMTLAELFQITVGRSDHHKPILKLQMAIFKDMICEQHQLIKYTYKPTKRLRFWLKQLRSQYNLQWCNKKNSLGRAMSETENPGASHWPQDLESLCPYTLLEWLDGDAQKFLEEVCS